jgi:cysteine synthase A
MAWLPASEHWSQSKFKHLFLGFLLGFAFSASSLSLSRYLKLKKRRQVEKFESRPIELRSDEIVSGVAGLIGTSARRYFHSMNEN